ncbi:hypothetical protein EVAR_93706_1 [Eumeta japonica]|uniref:Reverse transcriptase domain-containing protein n=1 Tax=Eumeta variegata TaxID=151549 RepID=A0A4C1U2Q6_EUMVA|nr:hypothetical protein EVAR_93706_1 [Eumeta japonica]
MRDKSRRHFRWKKVRRMAQLLLDAPFSVYELKLVLSSLKDSALGIDGIPYSFLINAPDQILSYYLDTVDSVVNTDDLAAYQQIALSSVLAKIAGYLVKNRLEWIAESRSLLVNCQNGFRKGRSTIDSLSIFTLNIRVSFFQEQASQAEDASEAK